MLGIKSHGRKQFCYKGCKMRNEQISGISHHYKPLKISQSSLKVFVPERNIWCPRSWRAISNRPSLAELWAEHWAEHSEKKGVECSTGRALSRTWANYSKNVVANRTFIRKFSRTFEKRSVQCSGRTFSRTFGKIIERHGCRMFCWHVQQKIGIECQMLIALPTSRIDL